MRGQLAGQVGAAAFVGIHGDGAGAGRDAIAAQPAAAVLAFLGR